MEDALVFVVPEELSRYDVYGPAEKFTSLSEMPPLKLGDVIILKRTEGSLIISSSNRVSCDVGLQGIPALTILRS